MQASRSVLRVALPVPLPRPFDYLPPPGVDAASVAIGQRILVPFGARELIGIVIGHGEAEAGIEPKPALALPDPAPLLQGELLTSLHWLAAYLHAPLGDVLATAMPAALRRGEPLPETTRHGAGRHEAAPGAAEARLPATEGEGRVERRERGERGKPLLQGPQHQQRGAATQGLLCQQQGVCAGPLVKLETPRQGRPGGCLLDLPAAKH